MHLLLLSCAPRPESTRGGIANPGACIVGRLEMPG
jgi:hypothetical protein